MPLFPQMDNNIDSVIRCCRLCATMAGCVWWQVRAQVPCLPHTPDRGHGIVLGIEGEPARQELLQWQRRGSAAAGARPPAAPATAAASLTLRRRAGKPPILPQIDETSPAPPGRVLCTLYQVATTRPIRVNPQFSPDTVGNWRFRGTSGSVGGSGALGRPARDCHVFAAASLQQYEGGLGALTVAHPLPPPHLTSPPPPPHRHRHPHPHP